MHYMLRRAACMGAQHSDFVSSWRAPRRSPVRSHQKKSRPALMDPPNARAPWAQCPVRVPIQKKMPQCGDMSALPSRMGTQIPDIRTNYRDQRPHEPSLQCLQRRKRTGWPKLILYPDSYCNHNFCVRSRTSTRLCAIKSSIVAECGLHCEFISNAGGDRPTL